MILLLTSLTFSHALPLSAEPCTFAPDELAWIESATGIWDRVREGELMLPAAPLPRLVLFDGRCVWEGSSAEELTGREHGGMISIPGGGEAPARLMTFAGRSDEDGSFLIMALAPLWREIEPRREGPELEALMRSVFVHEMTHTRQANSFGQRLDAIEASGDLQEELDDDIVQRKFEPNETYRALYEKERDALFAIAEEPDPAQRRAAALAVLRSAEQRRQKFFHGAASVYAELEDIFLAMEGVANWAGFRAAMLEGMSREDAIELMRGSRRPWTQEKGLALFLAIDALMSGWQKRAFSDDPDGAWELLAAAVAGGVGLQRMDSHEPVNSTMVPFAVVYPAATDPYAAGPLLRAAGLDPTLEHRDPLWSRCFKTPLDRGPRSLRPAFPESTGLPDQHRGRRISGAPLGHSGGIFPITGGLRCGAALRDGRTPASQR